MNWPYEFGASASTLHEAFASVVAHFQRPLAQFMFRFVHRQDAALDLTQEAFVKAFQNLHRYDSARSFSTWLFALASNLAKDHLRKHGQREEVPWEEQFEGDGDLPVRRPDHQVEAAELGAAIEHAIADLPLIYREPLLLRHTAGLSVEQTAEALETSVGVIKTRLFRARARLQEALGREWLPR